MNQNTGQKSDQYTTKLGTTIMGLQLTGHKYKYVGSLDIIDTDDKYIKELERQIENSIDAWNITCWQIYGSNGYVVEIAALKNELREVKAELFMIKKFLEKAKRKTNQQFDEDC